MGRLTLGLAAVAAALIMGPARAQAQNPGEHPKHPGIYTITSGAYNEIIDGAKAEHRLEHLEARLQHHTESGHTEAVERDLHHIRKTRFRLGVDQWLVRKNLCDQAGPYPPLLRVDSMTCAAMASVRRPQGTLSPPILPDTRLR
jgi:hypothetical protein